MIQAKVIADSVSPAGKRITSYELRYPRIILAELNTHRALSKSTSSSRAIPTAKLIEQVRTSPAGPVEWGKNQPGMQAKELLEGEYLTAAQATWRYAAYQAAQNAQHLANAGAHKQIVNRVLEPFLFVSTIVTGTEWENFFSLRAHPDADPTIRDLAYAIQAARKASTPRVIHPWQGRFHAPYILEDEWDVLSKQELAISSAARCARVSYLRHDGGKPVFEDDYGRFEKLAISRPVHASPLEHVAFPFDDPNKASRNFKGWLQFREEYETQGWGNLAAPGVIDG